MKQKLFNLIRLADEHDHSGRLNQADILDQRLAQLDTHNGVQNSWEGRHNLKTLGNNPADLGFNDVAITPIAKDTPETQNTLTGVENFVENIFPEGQDAWKAAQNLLSKGNGDWESISKEAEQLRLPQQVQNWLQKQCS